MHLLAVPSLTSTMLVSKMNFSSAESAADESIENRELELLSLLTSILELSALPMPA